MTFSLQDLGNMMKNLDRKMDDAVKTLQENINAVRTDVFHHLAQMNSDVQSEFAKSYHHIAESDKRIHTLEKHLIQDDVIITGIPKTVTKNVTKYFNDICVTIGVDAASVIPRSVFRLPSKSNMSPIIVKFCNPESKSEFFSKYKDFENLSITHIGLPQNKASPRIYINNCITKQCLELKKEAKRLLENGYIGRFQVKRGDIYVTLTGENHSIKILHMDQLRNIPQQ